MKDRTNYSLLEKIFKAVDEYITHEDIYNSNISSWFLSDFVKRNNLSKIAPGFYTDDNYIIDNYCIIQRRYPKYINIGHIPLPVTAIYLD